MIMTDSDDNNDSDGDNDIDNGNDNDMIAIINDYHLFAEKLESILDFKLVFNCTCMPLKIY